MTRIPYDSDRFFPPAPVVPLVVASPSDIERVELAALVDTGADSTLVPSALARALGLPRIDRASLRGIGPRLYAAPVHAAVVRIGRFRALVRVIAFGDEALVGRDLLERLALVLDGPASACEVRVPRQRLR
jgi:predicted aspartyl protease